jgi:hypothetical protein
MDKAKRARTAETPKQPSPGLKLGAPCLYPDRVMCFHFKENADRILLALLRPSPDALENLGDLFLRHDLTSSISGG